MDNRKSPPPSDLRLWQAEKRRPKKSTCIMHSPTLQLSSRTLDLGLWTLNHDNEKHGRSPLRRPAHRLSATRTPLLASLDPLAADIILRMEDIDSPRVKRGAADSDRRPPLASARLGRGARCGWLARAYVQTERLQLYRDALKQLKAAERVYPCTCSRTDIAEAASAAPGPRKADLSRHVCLSPRADATLARSASEGNAVSLLGGLSRN